jgi:hypothetical protein
VVRQAVDALLHGGAGAGGHEHVADPVQARRGEGPVAQCPVQDAQGGRIAVLPGAFAGDRHQIGGLPLAQVVTGGLAGHQGVAERAEEVVAQLEGQARTPARVAQGAPGGVARPGQCGAEGERALHGVQRALQERGAQRAGR